MAEAWEATWRQALAGAPRAAGLAAGYARVRGRLARAALRSPAASEALAWLARHARALSEEPGDRWLAWFAHTGDHGALDDRVHYAIEVLARAVSGDVPAARWLARFATTLAAGGTGHVGAIFAEVLRRSHAADLQTSHDFSPDGSGPTLSCLPPVYHFSCFADGNRSPGSSGGGNAGGDAGGDHRWSETS
jgi:hypothetical protein